MQIGSQMDPVQLTEQFVEFRGECWSTQMCGGDDAVLVNQNRMGDAAHAVGSGGGVLPAFQITHMVGPKQTVLGNCRFPFVRVLVKGYGENLKPLASELIVSVDNIRVFTAARPAPRSPKIDEYDLASEVTESPLVAVWVRHDDFRRLVTYTVS